MNNDAALRIDTLEAELKRMRPVYSAAMRESLNDLAREGPFEYTGTPTDRMMKLARFRNRFAAARLRACARAERKGKKS